MKKKVMTVFGTRPEAIKMCPLVTALRKKDTFTTYVCVTGQHREMLDQVLDAFGIVPDFDLSIMKENQDLFDVTIGIIDKLKKVLLDVNPDIVLVHGDTTTTFVTTLACFYLKIKVGHVEAGLRTYNINSPFPEEFNRQAVSLIAAYHFAPTKTAADNLISERVNSANIFVTGNTAIDALKTTVSSNYTNEYLNWVGDSRLILLTAHRRENLGEPMCNMFKAIKRIVDEFSDVKVIYPIHLNPKIRKVANLILGDTNRIRIVEPMNVIDFHNYLARSYFTLTDSGGIQEEAPSLGVPVLVMRDTTERPEGIEAGTLRLVGTDENNIYNECKLLLTGNDIYLKMSTANNPYGDGKASERIADILEDALLGCSLN